MTAPANKKRIHNDAARDAARSFKESKDDRTGQRLRRSKYAEKLRHVRAREDR